MQSEVTFAGFGGQGIMSIGQFVAYTGMEEGKEVCWLPSYGPEMRGGTAFCTIVVSDRPIGSPIINNPRYAVVMNRPSLDKFAPMVKSGGLLCINSSLIDVTSERDDIEQVLVPANDIAIEAKMIRSANLAMLGAFVGATGIVTFGTLKKFIKKKFARQPETIDVNLSILDKGHKIGKKHLK